MRTYFGQERTISVTYFELDRIYMLIENRHVDNQNLFWSSTDMWTARQSPSLIEMVPT